MIDVELLVIILEGGGRGVGRFLLLFWPRGGRWGGGGGAVGELLRKLKATERIVSKVKHQIRRSCS